MAPFCSTAIEVAGCQDTVEFVRFEFLCGHEGRENEDLIKGTMQQVSRVRQVNTFLLAFILVWHSRIVVHNSVVSFSTSLANYGGQHFEEVVVNLN